MAVPDRIFIGNEKIPIHLVRKPYCDKCMNEVSAGESLCHFCKELPPNGDDWYFNKVVCMGTYEHDDSGGKSVPLNLLSRLVWMFKYGDKKQQGNAKRVLGDGLRQVSGLFPFLIDGVQYLVASPKFDKSERAFGEVLIDLLIKNCPSLAGKDITSIVQRLRDEGDIKLEKRETRFEKMAGIHHVDIPDLHGQKVLILDDVFTSGATSWDLSRALKDRNAGEINVLALARASNFTNIVYDFKELLMFFSGFDSINESKNINDVPIVNLSITNTSIKCIAKGTQNYEIMIDTDDKIVLHDCENFQHKRVNNKEFCKHITKLFLELSQKRGVDFATQLLETIYRDLPTWRFQSI